MKKDKLVKNVKLYNIIMSNFWLLITTCLLGVIIGYFLDRNSAKKDNHYILFATIIAFVIGITNFFIHLIKEINKLNQEEQEEKDV